MAEQFLVLMAELDSASQKIMSSWYDRLKEAGFTGTQTPGLLYHISLKTFALDKEQSVISEMRELAESFAPVPVHISHIGVFAPGKVLFGAPDMNHSGLMSLRDAIQTVSVDDHPWTPHATILIDEPETVCNALPVLIRSFHPFMGSVTKLHLCAFWPTRDIFSVNLRSK